MVTKTIEAMRNSNRYNHHPFTEEGVLARLTETGFKYMVRSLASQFHAKTPQMRIVLNKLVEQGLIQIGKDSTNVVYFIPKEAQQPEPLPEGVAGYRNQFEFRPLVGYEARMREFADRRAA
jgi:hypothetical protein